MFDVLGPEDPEQVGRYRIVARIGAGGMGQVFLGRSPGGRPVAVKVVRPELAGDGDFRRRFAREVTAARRVNGAFTAGVVDADPDGAPAWLATVYVAGVSLGEAVAVHGPWPAEPVLALGAGLAEALEAIHAAGVVHRDLKPSNVLLAPDGPRVIDFGISSASEASALTHTGMTIGTPGFMSPEQLTGAPVGPASDVFALGAVLAFTATGVGPFGTGTPHALHFRAVYEEPGLDALPAEVRDLVAACLAKRPEERPSVGELLHLMGTRGDRAASDATLLLTEGWMPEAVNRLVRDRTATGLPRNAAAEPAAVPDPGPATAPNATPAPNAGPGRNPAPVLAPTPAPTPRPTPTVADAAAAPRSPVAPPATPDLPHAPTVHAAAGQPAPAASPALAPVPGLHEALTETGDQATPGLVPPPAPSDPAPSDPLPDDAAAEPAPPVIAYPGVLPGPLSRRGALLALTGTALAGGVGIALWKATGDGSRSAGSPAAGGSATTRPASSTPQPTFRPGQKRWEFDAGDQVETTPTVVGGVVYVGSNDHSFYAVDAATGKQRWAFAGEGLMRSTAVVANGLVYAGSTDGNLYAMDAATGRKRWAFATGGSVDSSPALVDGLLYFGSTDANMYAVDALTGKKRWSRHFPRDGLIEVSPAVAGGLVYTATLDHFLYALDAATGKVRWTFWTGDVVGSSATVANGVVYFGSLDHHLYAVDAAKGGKRWAFEVDGVNSTPTVAGGAVYFGADDERLYALDARTGAKRWAFRTGDLVDSSPAVADGVVYIGSDDSHLYAVDAVTGRQRWAFPTNGGAWSPAVADGVAYVGSKSGLVYAVQT
ncbi:PQQ-binding-like beta-propeller repeat protein [Streptomyces sp. NPDC020917]|uniref:serine/threonine-protein kinase n=1 Tax=Streptomyces sp. NPDC020917 TaxID=3365102 RepID=UPI0037A2484A